MAKVSYFKNVGDTTPKSMDLDKWLLKTIKPSKQLKDKVKRYRRLRSKKLKESMPLVTASAHLKKYRETKNIKSLSGFICLDIDRKENPCLDMERVKALFRTHPSCYFCGYSISGESVYVLMKIKPKKRLFIKYFKFFEKRLRNIGIVVDKQCKDMLRMRFISVDENAFYNPQALTFILPKNHKGPKVKSINRKYGKDDVKKVEAVLLEIERKKADITSSYDTWVRIGAAFYNAFGEGGRDYFHRVSRFYPKYKQKETDRKYTNCSKMHSIGLSTFFYHADAHGFRY